MMYWDGALSAAIEAAIAIAGFSGIVATIGRRNSAGRPPADIRLRVLLTASAAAGLFAFLPFVLFEAGLGPALTWSVGSAAQAVWLVAIMAHRLRQASRAGGIRALGGSPAVIAIGAIGVAGLVLNAAYLSLSWIYIIVVIWQLAVAFATFAVLLLEAVRE